MLGVSDERWAALERENARLEAEADRIDRERAYYADQLMAVTTGLAPLCACESCDCGRTGYCTDDGPCREDIRDQACPIHGDGATFVAEVRALRAVVERVRDRRDRIEGLATTMGGESHLSDEGRTVLAVARELLGGA